MKGKGRNKQNKKIEENKKNNLVYPIIVGVVIAIFATIMEFIIPNGFQMVRDKIFDNNFHGEVYIRSSKSKILSNLLDDIDDNKCNLKITESFISPLNTYKSIESSEDVPNYRKWLSMEGCILNAFVENVTEKDIPISEYKLRIDDIQPVEIAGAEIFVVCSDSKVNFYVVNCGNSPLLNAKMKLSAYYSDYLNSQLIELEGGMLSSIINTQDKNNEVELPNVEPGEIVKFAAFDMNMSSYNECQNILGNKDIRIYANTFFDDNYRTDISKNYLGLFMDRGDGLEIVLAEGGSMNAIKREVIIDLKEDVPFDINFQTEFKIDASEIELLQIAIFPKSTCKLTFHLEMKEVGGDYIKSPPMTQQIFIPLYDCSFYLSRIRLWVQNNNIIDYHYNDDRILQETINYKFSEEYVY